MDSASAIVPVQAVPASLPTPAAIVLPAAPAGPTAVAAAVPLPRSAQITLVLLLFLAAGLLVYHALHAASSGARPTDLAPYRVDLNHASREELMQIPGIGQATADRIIAYRSEQPFRSVEDLVKVRGIGSLTLNKLRRFLCVGDDDNDGDDAPVSAGYVSTATTGARPPVKKSASAGTKAAKGSGKPARTATKKKTSDQIVNINSAGMEELQTLTGIGPTRAAEIIREREKQPFKSVDDITRVSGIKSGILDKIRDRITVGEGPHGIVKAE